MMEGMQSTHLVLIHNFCLYTFYWSQLVELIILYYLCRPWPLTFQGCIFFLFEVTFESSTLLWHEFVFVTFPRSRSFSAKKLRRDNQIVAPPWWRLVNCRASGLGVENDTSWTFMLICSRDVAEITFNWWSWLFDESTPQSQKLTRQKSGRSVQNVCIITSSWAFCGPGRPLISNHKASVPLSKWEKQERHSNLLHVDERPSP